MWRLLLFGAALVGAWVVVLGLVYPLVSGAASVAGVRLNGYYWLSFPDWLVVAAAVLAHVLVMRWVERRPWSDLGLGRDALGARVVARGAALGGLAIALPSLLLVGVRLLRVEPSPDGSWIGAAAALLAKLAPLAFFEELLFRGYPFLVVRESAGPLPALAASSVVFGLAHLQNPGATPVSIAMVMLAGVFLGTVLLATGSLWAAFAAHLAWNWTLSAIVHSAVSGLPFAMPDYRTVAAGPDWITGGAWGPEGGIAAGAGMLSALALLWRRGAAPTLLASTARGPSAAGEHIDG